jgi:hypothetical protein
VLEPAEVGRGARRSATTDAGRHPERKFPVAVRLGVIFGLSAAFWSLILAALVGIFRIFGRA